MRIHNSSRPIVRMLLVAATVMFASGQPIPVQGQDSEPVRIEQDHQATIAFQLDLERLRSSQRLKDLGFARELVLQQVYDVLSDFVGFREVDFEKVTSFSGYFRPPNSQGELEQFMNSKALPLDFVVEIRSAKSERNRELVRELASRCSEIEIDSTIYLKPKSTHAMEQRLVLYCPDETLIRIGTDRFTIGAKLLTTEKLQNQIDNWPSRSFTLAIDGSCSPLHAKFLQTVLREFPDESAANELMKLVEMSESLEMGIDLDSANVVSIEATNQDPATMVVIAKLFEDALANAKQFSLIESNELKKENLKMAEAIPSVLDSIAINKTEHQITAALPATAALDSFLEGLAEQEEVQFTLRKRFEELSMIAFGVDNYQVSFNRFPWATREGTSELSWQVNILEFVNEYPLFEQFDLKSSWTFPKNKSLIEKMPAMFGPEAGKSNVVFVKHEKQPKNIDDVTDALANTIALIQLPDGQGGVDWTKPGIGISVDQALKLFEDLEQGEWILVAAYDTNVHRISGPVNMDEMELLLDPNDGGTVSFPEFYEAVDIARSDSDAQPPETRTRTADDAVNDSHHDKREMPAPTKSETDMDADTLDEAADSEAADSIENAIGEDAIRIRLELLSETIAADPEHEDALMARGMLYYYNKDNYQAAVEDFTSLISLEAIDDKLLKDKALDMRALCWMALEQYEKAVTDYSALIKNHPKHAFAISQRAFAYSEINQPEKAKADYQLAIELDAEDWHSMSNLSWLLASCQIDELRDGKTALKLATKACEITDWNESWIIDNVAAAHAELGDFEKAIKFAEMAIQKAMTEEEVVDIHKRLDLYKQGNPARDDK